jgi:hypothetical protein
MWSLPKAMQGVGAALRGTAQVTSPLSSLSSLIVSVVEMVPLMSVPCVRPEKGNNPETAKTKTGSVMQ